LTCSRRSTAETQNCAYIALDQKYISNDKFEEMYNQGFKTIQIIDGLLRLGFATAIALAVVAVKGFL
jgi:four helix bundle protein